MFKEISIWNYINYRANTRKRSEFVNEIVSEGQMDKHVHRGAFAPEKKCV